MMTNTAAESIPFLRCLVAETEKTSTKTLWFIHRTGLSLRRVTDWKGLTTMFCISAQFLCNTFGRLSIGIILHQQRRVLPANHGFYFLLPHHYSVQLQEDEAWNASASSPYISLQSSWVSSRSDTERTIKVCKKINLRQDLVNVFLADLPLILRLRSLLIHRVSWLDYRPQVNNEM